MENWTTVIKTVNSEAPSKLPGTTRSLWTMVPLGDVASCAQTSWLIQEDNHHTKFMTSRLWEQVQTLFRRLNEVRTLAGREIKVKRIAEGV